MNDQLQFVADSAMASELALAVLLQTLADLHPETAEDFRDRVGYLLLSNRKDISPGARENLESLIRSLVIEPREKKPTGG